MTTLETFFRGYERASLLSDVTAVLNSGVQRYKALTSQPPVSMVDIRGSILERISHHKLKKKIVWVFSSLFFITSFEQLSFSEMLNRGERLVLRELRFATDKGLGQCRQYSDSLRAIRSGDRIPVRTRFSAPVQAGLGAYPASCTMGSGSLSRG